jgi:hypothetical protein
MALIPTVKVTKKEWSEKTGAPAMIVNECDKAKWLSEGWTLYVDPAPAPTVPQDPPAPRPDGTPSPDAPDKPAKRGRPAKTA